MNRRTFLCGLTLGMLAAPLAVEAQQAGKVYRIGVLEVVPMTSNVANIAAFRQGLREYGYVEGQNLVIEYRSADGQAVRFDDLASELVRRNVDVIVTRGTPAALAAKQATGTVPIVMVASGDPPAEGLVTSLARLGENVTGLQVTASPELASKRLQVLKEMVPGLSRVVVLRQDSLYSELMMRETETVARAMGVQLRSFEVRRTGFERAFEEALLAQGQVDALITVEGFLTLANQTRIVDFAALSKLPAIYGLRAFVDVGGLMSYGVDLRDLFRRAATYIHRILEGVKPVDLPVGTPTKFELVINLKTAKALGLTIPQTLLLRADQVTE